jgi:hypothetical protein
VCRCFWPHGRRERPSAVNCRCKRGGLAACGALLMSPSDIVAWAQEVRAASSGRFQINLWTPDPSPVRNAVKEKLVRDFFAHWGPMVEQGAGDDTPPDFAAQCEALLEARPPIVSSVTGLYSAEFVNRLKSLGIAWFANTSTVAESKAAEAAGADVVVAQGMEAGGHRGCFDANKANRLCARRHFGGRATTGTLSGPARAYCRHERSCIEGRRRESHAGMGGPISWPRSRAAGTKIIERLWDEALALLRY